MTDLPGRVVEVMGEARSRDTVIPEIDARVRCVAGLGVAAKGVQGSADSPRGRRLARTRVRCREEAALPLALVPSLGYWRGSMGKSGLFRCH
ncbi:MAG: hypothetical protein F4213_10520 [Boseongicola sp. SB0677_bin_26]|nr:hypothetical protein [Boseongicola sp. SB0665_bin_10]MYG26441.1 hypothetical protein [Boseongicola sp. SB0677_bin_26]